MFNLFISDSVWRRITAGQSTLISSQHTLLLQLLKQQSTHQLSAAQTLHLKTHPETVLQNPSSLYILDLPEADAISIQQSYGVMCMSGDNIDISPLIDVNDVHISNVRERLERGWDAVLDSVEALPSNALLLTDRYLFAFRQPDAGDGLANIRDILTELLPLKFQGDAYHVTVVFDDMAKHSSYTFDEIATKLNRIKMQLGRAYPIMMEVLGITHDCSIYNMLHNRLIVSNYYLVEASHKLAAFNQGRGTARQMLLPLALFTESSLNGSSTPPLKAITQILQTLRDFSSSLSSLKDHNIYSYAVNGKRMVSCTGLKNRLLE